MISDIFIHIHIYYANYSSMSKHLAWLYISSSTRLCTEINQRVIGAIENSQIITSIAYQLRLANLYQLLQVITQITT